jgi:hypothetical protein
MFQPFSAVCREALGKEIYGKMYVRDWNKVTMIKNNN